MKDVLKNLGLIFIVVGVIILSLAVFKETQSNAKLVISLILIVVGFLGHIFVNKFVD